MTKKCAQGNSRCYISQMPQAMILNFADQVKRLRTQMAVSQEELARELGVSFATVNRWENGHRAPLPMARRAFEALCLAKGVKL